MNGPLPMTRFEASPSASITSRGMIQKIGEPMAASNGTYTSLRVNCTVLASGAVTDAT